MRTLWRGLVRTIFWSYERGSWPYDVMVLAIVLFVMLTPRSWFHDQPQSGVLPGADVELVSEDSASRMKIYRIDAHLLAPPKRTTKPTPELERETHDILSKTVDDLKGHTFQIGQIDPILGDDGAVLYYDVAVKT
jgi:hypothetical protein